MAAAGFRLLQENATRLVRDARLLYDARRYASAGMLAAMALDEIARLPILMEIFARDKGHEHAWDSFRETRRDFPWTILDTAMSETESEALNGSLAFIRTIGNTVECLGAGNWVDPAQLIQPALVKELIAVGELLCLGRVNSKAIQLWLETLQTTAKTAGPGRLLDRFEEALEAADMSEEADTLNTIRTGVPSLRR